MAQVSHTQDSRNNQVSLIESLLQKPLVERHVINTNRTLRGIQRILFSDSSPIRMNKVEAKQKRNAFKRKGSWALRDDWLSPKVNG